MVTERVGSLDVPEEVLATIFAFLPWPTSMTLRAVCKNWLRLSDDDSLWRGYVRGEYGIEALRDVQEKEQGWRAYFIHRKTREVEIVVRGQAWSRHHEVMVRVPRQGTVETVRLAVEAAVRARGGGPVNADTSSYRFSLRQAGARASDCLDSWRALASVGILRNGHALAFDAVRTTRLTLNV